MTLTHKHGPHLYVSLRGPHGTAGYYWPQALAQSMREGVAAWPQLQDVLQEWAELNRERPWAQKAARGPPEEPWSVANTRNLFEMILPDGEKLWGPTLIRVASALGPQVLKAMLKRLANLARQPKVVRGLKLRVDTTVVETHIHYPADSSLLADGVRVLTRTTQKISQGMRARKVGFRDRT